MILKIFKAKWRTVTVYVFDEYLDSGLKTISFCLCGGTDQNCDCRIGGASCHISIPFIRPAGTKIVDVEHTGV